MPLAADGEGGPSSEDAGPEVARPPIDAGCTLRVKPAPPDPVLGSGGGRSFVTVFADLSLEEPGADFCIPSENLDGVDTCNDAGASCTGGSGGACDKEGGVDRMLNDVALQPNFKAVIDTVPALNLTGQVRSGRFAILLRVSDYNGTPNDANVTVEYFFSNGLAVDGGKPAFDTTDVWTIDKGAVRNDDSGIAAVRDLTAYVTDGVLVSRAATSLTALAIPISNATVVARVSASEPFHLTDARWSGYAPVTELLRTISLGATGGTPLCPGNSTYDQLAAVACAKADLSTHALLADAPCDALSVSLAVRGRPATLGDVVERVTPPSRCWPDGGSPPPCP